MYVLAVIFLLGSVLLIVPSVTSNQSLSNAIFADDMGPPSSGDGETLPDGDGETLPDGDGETLPDGDGENLPGEDQGEAPQITTNSVGSTSTVYPDGSKVTEYPDGTIEICPVSYDAQESKGLPLLKNIRMMLKYPVIDHAQYYSVDDNGVQHYLLRQVAEDDTAIDKICETFGKQDGATTETPSAETPPDDSKTTHESLGGGSFKETTFRDDGSIKEVRIVKPGGVEEVTLYSGHDGKPTVTKGYDRMGNVISDTAFNPNGKPTTTT